VTRFCATCGTEVDETAVFCPTCGQPIDQETETEMPPAPAWPQPQPRSSEAVDAAPERDEPESAGAMPPRGEGHRSEPEAAEVTRVVEPQPRPDVDSARHPAPGPRSGRPTAPPPPAREPAGQGVDLPLTMPVTLSAWLIGGGAALGALGALIAAFDGLGTAIDLLLLVGLVAVAATVFLSDRLPNVPQLRLITLSVVMVALGVALDRLGFGRAGAGDLLLFLGTAAAAIGAIILETGRDQPLGGPSA
jgi:hypothetical protein